VGKEEYLVQLWLIRMMDVRWMNSLREISGVMDGYVETDRQTDKLSIQNYYKKLN
jgi:hypothetical protein